MRSGWVLLSGLIITGSSWSAAPMPLWPNGPPEAKGKEEPDTPTITAYLPAAEAATGAGVVICPGGGYGHLASRHEGQEPAEFLNKLGVAAFVLRYRHAPQYKHPCPMLDAQRAIRVVRSRAKEFLLDERKIGIWGFSAGGHLASTIATHFDAGQPDAPDPIDRASCRPDFAILCYPVIDLKGPMAHSGSRKNLLGENPDPALLDSLCNHTQVSDKTPPCFLFHTGEDTGVPPENSIMFYLACREKKVPAELHIYQPGRHGVGLAPHDPVLKSWPERLTDWMKVHRLLKPSATTPIKGTVSIDGKPMKAGTISLNPYPQLNGLAVATTVKDGAFEFKGEQHPTVGMNIVHLMGAGVPTTYSYGRSPLRVEVTEQKSTIDLNLQSP